MIEIEFSALIRLCLKRRIPAIDELEREVLAIVADRKAKQIRISWQFSKSDIHHKVFCDS